MKNFIDNLFFSINVMHAILTNTLPGKIKFDLFKGYFKCKWALLLNKQAGVSLKIGPYTYKSPSARYFKTLLIEVMIKEEYYIELKTDQPVIIDCGSNVGFSVLYFKLKFPNAKIIAIEANKETFDVLSENIKQFNNVTAYNCFASNVSDSSVDFYTKGVGDVTSSLVSDRGGAIHNVVKSVSINSLVGNSSIDILKMDIEGGEFAIFNEKENLDYLKNVNNILLEYHHIFENGKTLNSLAGFLNVFEKQNFGYNITSHTKKEPVGYFQDFLIKMKRQGLA